MIAPRFSCLRAFAGSRFGNVLRTSYEEWLAWAPDNLISEWADRESLVLMTATPLHQRLVRVLLTQDVAGLL